MTEPKLTFQLTANETNAIFAGLNELPAKIANPVLGVLEQQAKAQIQPAPVAEQTQPELLLEGK